MTIRTRDDASFEGTALDAGGDASISAGGNVEFNAAQDTASSSSTGVSVGVDLGTSKTDSGGTEKSAELGASAENAQTSSTTARTGSINAGGGITVSSGNDITLEGTPVKAGERTELSAGNEVKLETATSTSSSSGIKAGVSLSGSTGGGRRPLTPGLACSLPGAGAVLTTGYPPRGCS
ncbi:hemagglutinin repeat-containing protein [Litchfieldella xinjiangensis]|uniref:hemagglutinin repeat-containing protein n=1 Tax=Litchfieldella xinjiangensis TaxID=1166948 RepID=UPI0009DD061C